jgi:hypothetical protein
MKSGRLCTVVFIAVVPLAGCAAGSETAAPSSTQQSPTPQSSAPGSPPAAVLDGTYRLDFDLTRTGDVDAGLTMPVPAKEPPRKPAPPEGFRGRYMKSVATKDGTKAPDVEIEVSTSCIRNVLHCLTYAVYTPPGTKGRSVLAYEFKGKTWKGGIRQGGIRQLTKCPSAAGVTLTTNSEWWLPAAIADPIPRLMGTQQELYPQPCPAAVVSDVVITRIGD